MERDPTALRLAGPLNLRVEPDGQICARSGRGDVQLSPDELALAIAFGAGAPPEQAARDAGFAWDEPTRGAIAGLVAAGVLVAAVAPAEPDDAIARAPGAPRVAERFFDEHADAWIDDAYRGRYRRGARRMAVVVARLDALAAGRSLEVLDLGCGAGDLALALAARGHRVTGIDQAARMIARAHHETTRVPAEVSARVAFRVQRLSDPLPDAAYDVVTALGVLPYVDDQRRLLEVAGGALRRDGHLVLSAPNRLATLSTSPIALAAAVADAGPLLEELNRHLERHDRDGTRAVDALASPRARVCDVEPSASNRPPPGRIIAGETWAQLWTPDEIAALAAPWFEPVAAFGFMPPMLSALAIVADPRVESALVAPFDALAGHPLSLAWSDELVIVMRRR